MRCLESWTVTYVEGNLREPGTWNATWWLTRVQGRTNATAVQRGSPARKTWRHTDWGTRAKKGSNVPTVLQPSPTFVDCNSTLTSTQRRLSLVKRAVAGAALQMSAKLINLLLSAGDSWARPNWRLTWKNVAGQGLVLEWPKTTSFSDATSALPSSRTTNEWKNT